MITLLEGNCRDVIRKKLRPGSIDCIFADPPDNIGLKYDGGGGDNRPLHEYEYDFCRWLLNFTHLSPVVWMSFNARHLPLVGWATREGYVKEGYVVKPCVQTFTFGQHNKHDLGNNYRPLWRFMAPGVELYPDDIRVQSARQLQGDKRADPRGRVPGDVFDYTRVVGNSKQRRRWHPTQLNEELVECCLRLTTKKGDVVLDPFAGTGTTARVCERIDRHCVLIESNPKYCDKLREEFNL